MQQLYEVLGEWTDAPESLLRAFRAVIEERNALRVENTRLARAAEDCRESLEAYKEATGIVRSVEQVDRLNRSLDKEAERAVKLEAEVARLKRGEFTPEEFQNLCHHRDETPGCTRAAFEDGCRVYQEKLFGKPAWNLEEAVLTNTPHPSHVWNGTILNCCIRCEAYHGQPSALLPCDPSKLAGKTEWCCECGEDYPRSDLIAGHIYCAKCRAPESKTTFEVLPTNPPVVIFPRSE
jgi:regulator of replication initiation timing